MRAYSGPSVSTGLGLGMWQYHRVCVGAQVPYETGQCVCFTYVGPPVNF